MTLKRTLFVVIGCFLLLLQQVTAVVNNKPQNINDNSTTNQTTTKSTENTEVQKKVQDSVASSSDQDTNRREAYLTDSYGAPLFSNGDSYTSGLGSLNNGLPKPVYGVPNGPSNNIIYPSPPPEISLIDNYGPPKPTYGAPQFLPSKYGPPPPPLPSTKYGSPFNQRLPKPSFPQPFKKYGLPRKPFFQTKYPKPVYGVPSFGGPPKPIYGPPKHKPIFTPQSSYGPPQLPKPTYGGPPKPVYGAPLKPLYGAPPKPVYGAPPKPVYGAPSKPVFGLPDPVPHGPPHPGVPAPPTPPDITYDGWQPIPGLISRPPIEHYAQNTYHGQGQGDLQFNSDFLPPPLPSSGPSNGLSDSYGAPLNSVTGSGGIVSSSGSSHVDQSSLSLGLSAAGIEQNNQLSVIKSVGYELFPNSDSYSSPPLNSYSQKGPYPNSIGLIPPSGVYGAPPNSQYGTPLISSPVFLHSSNSELKINPPKHPVIFREPVPSGLIESVGKHTAFKDAHGIIDSPHSNTLSTGPTYIPPPISDPTKDDIPLSPSNLYSLPSPSFPPPFRGSSAGEFNQNFNVGGSQGFVNSYAVPLGSIDGAYSLPLSGSEGVGLTVGFEPHPPVTIDLTNTNFDNHQNYDCNLQKSQPLPSFSYGVPSANGYTASLSTLNANIASYGTPALTYGVPDSHGAHSVSSAAALNAISESYAKSLGSGSELIKSENIDFNNIPLRGNLGTYTLQIQPADGLSDDASTNQIPHDQVLNDGLLQSILAAIEQPQQYQQQQQQQHQYEQQEQQQQLIKEFLPHDVEPQNSVPNAVVLSPLPPTSPISPQQINISTSTAIPLVDNNEIALYFNNKNHTNSDIRNGQQYGTYIINNEQVNNNLPNGSNNNNKQVIESINNKN